MMLLNQNQVDNVVEIELYFDWSFLQETENEVVGSYGSHSDVKVSKLKNRASIRNNLEYKSSCVIIVYIYLCDP